MMQMTESRMECIRQEAKRLKAIAVEKYNAGDLVGAKEFAVKAKDLDPELCGLRRLNAVLDVKMAFEKKTNGEVDHYAVLSADPTEDLGTIQRRYSKLAFDMISDRDNNVGGIEEAEKIIADAFRYLSKEKKNQALARRRESIRLSLSQGRERSSSLNVSGPVNRLSSTGGEENKRKGPPPTDQFRVHQLRRIEEDAKIRRDSLELRPNMRRIDEEAKIRRDSLELRPNMRRIDEEAKIRSDSLELRPSMLGIASVVNATSMVRPSRLSYGSASQHENVGAAVKTRSLQDLNKSDAMKRVKIEESKKTTSYVVDEEELVMSVQDADFYNFDKDRTEASFGENQVWAAYDEYGMPRYYALVHKVVSQEPFKLCVSWLNTKKNDELGPMKWLESGYYKTSGRFSIGKRTTNESLNSFSHRVEWTKGVKTLVHIYPKKGNVWALYTNWSTSWNYYTSLEEMNVYDMVEVLQDFDEKGGTVTVAPLVKVPGFHTVFRRHDQKTRTYPKKELFKFSHQVAYHVLTGKEGKNAPRGCLELDPAAMTEELLKVLTEEEAREMENSV